MVLKFAFINQLLFTMYQALNIAAWVSRDVPVKQ